MIGGREEKLQMPEANLNNTIDELRVEIVGLLRSNNIIPPESPNQIRLIYSGKILKGPEKLESVINTSVQPPYTMQLMIRPPGSEPEKEQVHSQESTEDNEGCCLLI